MAVHVQCQGHGRVAKPFRHDLRVNAGTKCNCCVRVTEIMKPDAGQARNGHQSCESLGHAVRMEETIFAIREYESIVPSVAARLRVRRKHVSR